MPHRLVDRAAPEFTHCSDAFEAEFDYLYRTVLRHGVPPQDAEDAVQSVFVTMWRRWADYDRTRPLRPWLAGIAVRAANHLRRRREIPVGIPVATDGAPDPEQRLSATRARALVMAALTALPEKYRAVLVMHELDELSVTEVAGVYDISLQTASARVRAARKAFGKTISRLTKTRSFRSLALVPSAEAVLAVERTLPAAPELARRRAIARARAFATSAAMHRPPSPNAPERATAQSAAILGAVVAVVVTTVMLVAARPALLTPPRRTAISAPRKGASAANTPLLMRSHQASSTPKPEARGPRPEARIAYFPFDESPGSSTAHDRSGNGNHCLLHDLDGRSIWIPGASLGAIRFGGRGWLECPRVDRLALLTDEITVAAWIRPRSRWGAQAIVARQKGTSRADDLFFGLVNDQLVVASRTFRKRLDRPFPHPDGQWVHVAFTRRADGTLTLFAGGSPIGQNRGRPMSIGGGSTPLTIGGAVNGPDRSSADELFAGDIDEVVVYDRALSPSELDALATHAQR